MAADVEVAAINSPSDGAGEGGEGGGEGGGDGDGGNSLRCDEAVPESEPMETDTPAREQSLADSPAPFPPRLSLSLKSACAGPKARIGGMCVVACMCAHICMHTCACARLLFRP